MTTTADRTDPAADRAARIAAALRDPDQLFTSAQVADLMATAMRWGREAGIPPIEASPEVWLDGYDAGMRTWELTGPVYDPASPSRWLDQVDYRRRCDWEARRPRPGDSRGGPARPWPPTWCGRLDRENGDPLPHRPHRVEDVDDEGRPVKFRCEGRRP